MKNILFKNIARKKGRNLVITPDNTDLKLLSVGRIILDSEIPNVEFDSLNKEISLICLHGEGEVKVNDLKFKVKSFDGVYVPRDSKVFISTNSNVDFVESNAPVSKQYPVAYVDFNEVKNDPKLHLSLGKENDRRELYNVIGGNVAGGRLLAGPTFSHKGNWTSWPPHEHTSSREEVYLYFDMPKPGFGLQGVYTNTTEPEYFIPVFEDDAVVIKEGYHPNVAIPGHSINFVWLLCALREEVDREWGASNVQPEFKT